MLVEALGLVVRALAGDQRLRADVVRPLGRDALQWAAVCLVTLSGSLYCGHTVILRRRMTKKEEK